MGSNKSGNEIAGDFSSISFRVDRWFYNHRTMTESGGVDLWKSITVCLTISSKIYDYVWLNNFF